MHSVVAVTTTGRLNGILEATVEAARARLQHGTAGTLHRLLGLAS